MKDFLGYGRSRSSSGKGDVVKRHFNEYVNCLHTQVGTARENMEVLVAEFLQPIGCAMRGSNPENPSERRRSNGKYKQRIEMGSNISNTITSVQKDSLVAEPLRIPQATKQGYIEVPPGSLFDMSYPESKTRRGRVQEGGKVSPTLMASGEAPCYYEGTAKKLCLNSKVDGKRPSLEHRIYDSEGIATAMTTGFHPNIQEPTFRIRKLTPRECFRLMGVSESDIDKIQQSGVSQSQQYRMAGNSIVVDVLEHIFRKMFVDKGQESQQLSLF